MRQVSYTSLYSDTVNVAAPFNNVNKYLDPTKGEIDAQQGSVSNIELFKNLIQYKLKDDKYQIEKTDKNWLDQVFEGSKIYYGLDEILWGKFMVCVQCDKLNRKQTVLILDKLGVTFSDVIDVSNESQFYPAIENLDPKHNNSLERKCIAVALLQKYSLLSEEEISKIKSTVVKNNYDQIHAGDLASRCEILETKDVKKFGETILNTGLLQDRTVKSTLMDVIYKNESTSIELNNRLVYHLGEQLEQLFNPLTEYSPEQTEYTYKPPEEEKIDNTDSELTKAICNELLQFQTKFALNLVDFLQNFLIALRVEVLNEKINGLSTVKLNRLFPPTIDEVTRINCIFLDSLKAAIPFGAFEVLKACSVTIPYFYKAYTRHEAATKKFNKDIKLFLANFGKQIPSPQVYTEMKIETIIKGPQEKLMKLKLIMDRLWESQKWSDEEKDKAKEYYDNIIEIIHSFGTLKEPISSYSTRVFTPSGKILTELAKKWPVELQYKWLKRRVVGVFDVVLGPEFNDRGLLVIFSDYIVFLDIMDAHDYYNDKESNKPWLANVLMNSLINEVPLPSKIPTLNVSNYCYIDKVIVSVYERDIIRFDSFYDSDPFSISCKVISKTTSTNLVADLITKAKILEKDTAFHLFRANENGILLYSTAHEIDAYEKEKIKSNFSLFLNIDPSAELLDNYNIHVAFFAKLIDRPNGETIQLDILTRDNRKYQVNISPDKLIPEILHQLSYEIPICYSSLRSNNFSDLLNINKVIISNLITGSVDKKDIVDEPNGKTSADSFTMIHSKHRSYGSITTFRSYKSDMKDGSAEPIKEKVDATTPIENKRDTIRTQPQTILKDSGKTVPKTKTVHSQKQAVKTEVSAAKEIERPRKSNVKDNKKKEKRKSFVGAFIGLFGSKEKKNKSSERNNNVKSKEGSKSFLKRKQKQKASKKTISKPQAIDKSGESNKIADNNLNIAERNNKSSERHEDKIEDSEQQRVSSVIRNKDYYSSKDNQPATVEKAEMVNKRTDNKVIELKKSEILTKEVDGIQNNSKISTKDIFDKSFNDDLFGNYKVGNDTTVDKVKEQNNQDSNPNTENLKQNTSSKHVPIQTTIPWAKDIDTLTFALNITKEDNNSKLVDTDETSKNEIHTEKAIEQTSKSDSKIGTIVDKDNEDAILVEKNIRMKDQSIFPVVPKLIQKNIDFSRSASYKELFEITRLVLDELDAQYNWKRLKQEASLSENHVISASFGSTEDLVETEIESKKDIDNVTPEVVKSSDSNKILKISDIPILEPDSSLDNSEITKDFLNDLENIVDDVLKSNDFKKQSPSIQNQHKVFKVIKTTSPTMVNKNFDKKSSTDSNSDARSNEIPKKLLPSVDLVPGIKLEDEEEEEDQYLTPSAEPSAVFEQDMENETSKDSSDESTVNDTNKSVRAEILEDLNFSSFHMSFDDSKENEVENSVNLGANSELLNQLTKKNDTFQSPFAGQAPLIYRLPKSSPIKNTANNISGAKKLNRDDNDAIWVSPSKIPFYDFNGKPESNVQGKKSKAAVQEQLTNLQISGNSNMNKDISYTYLAGFIDSPDLGESNSNRLKFKE
ncbi:hypothetical protein Kpol_1048p67 [Vanderwaltozyma polyspora DSM 70294]|uniref:DH domain-containing protein n=1 Tax=Vanderwaltozyma polyspora (strain ATCC 22028 / DSM 70294 / BCRC 21397 / CBS 2163 / NBRC 10782 / NRRL Y-8283 / UCD 57-17) TaxID=436907 RepID=A7TGM9_VANPO|nr:uncharacterized protein Kpol_1048p67 [Vanderwaltozyma polyspora DSM 70294]EDO18636.1 hypothetical protein Kpol_1048p67 [Vanderwaltozyma polyspora DSM 70294]